MARYGGIPFVGAFDTPAEQMERLGIKTEKGYANFYRSARKIAQERLRKAKKLGLLNFLPEQYRNGFKSWASLAGVNASYKRARELANIINFINAKTTTSQLKEIADRYIDTGTPWESQRNLESLGIYGNEKQKKFVDFIADLRAAHGGAGKYDPWIVVFYAQEIDADKLQLSTEEILKLFDEWRGKHDEEIARGEYTPKGRGATAYSAYIQREPKRGY